jgi:hypothetical protein
MLGNLIPEPSRSGTEQLRREPRKLTDALSGSVIADPFG